MPFGFLNRNHEPPVYYGVLRNEVETRIIPSTWREGGVSVYGSFPYGFDYDLGVTTGFDAPKLDDPASHCAPHTKSCSSNVPEACPSMGGAQSGIWRHFTAGAKLTVARTWLEEPKEAAQGCASSEREGGPVSPKAELDLSSIQVLLLDKTRDGAGVARPILYGFGVRQLTRCTSIPEAVQAIDRSRIELIIIEATRDRTGLDFLRLLRREGPEPNRYSPALIVAGHTPPAVVASARDAGANFVVTKPLTPQILLDRLYWVSQDKRSFIVTDAYAGPDRRVHAPTATSNKGRRSEDAISRERDDDISALGSAWRSLCATREAALAGESSG